jgi:signal transduction histidine kinase
MPNGGTLEISCFSGKNSIHITVSDTGVGIPDDFKSKLFKPMMTTKAKGQGLGLAVVKRLVEALNGKVTFESQEGKGTIFTIALPKKVY